MFNIGDYVVYKREICKIDEIKKNYVRGMDYYSMSNITDPSLIINVPINSSLLRHIISREEALDIISKIASIDVNVVDDKRLENEYKELMKSDKIEDLIKIIKITYKRCEDRVNNGKKISEKDDNYFKKAESIFYSEMSLALNMSYDDVKEYIINCLKNIESI